MTAAELEHSPWGERTNKLFQYIRGTDLTAFDSYVTLNKLQLLGNACRHGDGNSSRKLFKLHPELCPEQYPSVHSVQWRVELLAEFVDAIVLFWIDMDIMGLESLVNKQPTVPAEIVRLQARRIPLLANITR
ncbi:hypothetical protein D3C76_1475290 [compost metagenome]